MERQVHGLLYGGQIVEEYELQESGVYTSRWDAYCDDIPCSIKSIKHGSAIDMGDINRQRSVDRDFLFFIGFWRGDKSNLVEEHVLYVPVGFWRAQFPDECASIIDPKVVFDGISNDRADDAKWKDRTRRYRKMWREHEGAVAVRYKRDHKSQRRIQCAIKRRSFYEDMLDFHLQLDSDDSRSPADLLRLAVESARKKYADFNY